MKKIWMGFGISHYYKTLSEKIIHVELFKKSEEIIFLIADNMQKKYNNHLNKEIIDEIYFNLKKIKNSRIILSKDIEKIIPISLVISKYEKNKQFNNDVKKIVQKNRKNIDNLERLAGYVLEQLALTLYFHQKGFQKAGTKEKEEVFDTLLITYFNLSKYDFIYF